MAREPVDFFVVGLRAADLSIAIYRRSPECRTRASSFDWRYRVHVRSGVAADDPPAELVSRRNPSPASLGDLAIAVRSAGLESADVDDVGGDPREFFLAAGGGCELGARAVLSRAAHRSRMDLPADLPRLCATGDLLPDALVFVVAVAEVGRSNADSVILSGDGAG